MMQDGTTRRQVPVAFPWIDGALHCQQCLQLIQSHDVAKRSTYWQEDAAGRAPERLIICTLKIVWHAINLIVQSSHVFLPAVWCDISVKLQIQVHLRNKVSGTMWLDTFGSRLDLHAPEFFF